MRSLNLYSNRNRVVAPTLRICKETEVESPLSKVALEPVIDRDTQFAIATALVLYEQSQHDDISGVITIRPCDNPLWKRGVLLADRQRFSHR